MTQLFKRHMQIQNLHLLHEQKDTLPGRNIDHIWTNNNAHIARTKRLEAYLTNHDIVLTHIDNIV